MDEQKLKKTNVLHVSYLSTFFVSTFWHTLSLEDHKILTDLCAVLHTFTGVSVVEEIFKWSKNTLHNLGTPPYM